MTVRWKRGFAVLAGIIILGLLFSHRGLAAGKHPFGLNENQTYGILTNGYESPHVTWAKPYAGGSIKALVMAPEWSQRETVELAERLSLDYTPWMTSAFSQVAIPADSWWLPTPTTLIDKLLRDYMAADFDVIVIGKLDWAMLPLKQRFNLLKKVFDGTGLVYIGPPAGNEEIDLVYSRQAAPEGAAFIGKGIPFASLPQLKSLPVEKIIRAGRFGKGRIVALDYGQKMPAEKGGSGNVSAAAAYPALTPQWAVVSSYSEERFKGFIPPDDCAEMEFVPYEYYQSLVARAVVWASGKDSGASLGAINLPAEINWPASEYQAAVSAESAPAGAILKAVVRSRFEYDRVYELPSQPASASNQVTLPAIPSGEYFLDVWLTAADGKVFDWGSRGFTVKADIVVRKIALGGKSYNPGDTITGTVSLSRPLAAGEVVMAELCDNYGRVITAQPLTATGEAYPFSFTLLRPLSILHNIHARVVRQGHDLCTSRLHFPVRAKLKGLDDFNEVLWAGPDNQFLSLLALRKLAQQDQADVVYVGFSGGTHARNIAAMNLALLPYTAGFGLFGEKITPPHPYRWLNQPASTRGPYSTDGCMTDPATFKGIDEWGAMQSDIFGPYGPLSWGHGDENYYSNHPDTCWSDTCLAEFRNYLKGIYPDLAVLNQEWTTGYKTWDEVLPATFEEALKTNNYAPWVEHRLAQQWVYARLYKHTGTALSVNDPGANVGHDGNHGFDFPNGGTNWWRLKDHMGLMQVYYSAPSGAAVEMELIRSFAGPQHLTGMYYGTYWNLGPGPNNVENHHFFPWYSLFHGLNSTWFWTMGSPGIWTGYAPDFTNMPFMQASRDALAKIRTGTGKLLLAGDLQDDAIAVHYSEVSHIVDALLSGITDDQLPAGISINVKRPVTSAWRQELHNVTKTIEDSGLQYRFVAYEEVEADALLKRGYKAFLMPHSRAVSQKEADAIRGFVNNGGLLIADILPGILNGHGTRQKVSMLADLFPSREPGVVNRIGKGKTVLVGSKLAAYGPQGWKDESRQILAKLLADEAGIRPQIQITPRDGGSALPPTEIFRTRAGEGEYVGLLREYRINDTKPYSAAVRFPRKSHLYNMRTGKYLGFTDSVETEVSYEAQLYALLPYRVSAVKIDAPSRALPGETTSASITLQAGWRVKPSLHVFRLEICGPDGAILPYYSANLTAPAGKAEQAISWALNEKPGRYIVRVRDTASGIVGEKPIEIRAR